MQSRWNDADAREAVETYAGAGLGEDAGAARLHLAAARQRPALVLHGGGNTSVKTRMTDLLGETHEVLCVKGSRLGHGHASSRRACRR